MLRVKARVKRVDMWHRSFQVFVSVIPHRVLEHQYQRPHPLSRHQIILLHCQVLLPQIDLQIYLPLNLQSFPLLCQPIPNLQNNEQELPPIRPYTVDASHAISKCGIPLRLAVLAAIVVVPVFHGYKMLRVKARVKRVDMWHRSFQVFVSVIPHRVLEHQYQRPHPLSRHQIILLHCQVHLPLRSIAVAIPVQKRFGIGLPLMAMVPLAVGQGYYGCRVPRVMVRLLRVIKLQQNSPTHASVALCPCHHVAQQIRQTFLFEKERWGELMINLSSHDEISCPLNM